MSKPYLRTLESRKKVKLVEVVPGMSVKKDQNQDASILRNMGLCPGHVIVVGAPSSKQSSSCRCITTGTSITVSFHPLDIGRRFCRDPLLFLPQEKVSVSTVINMFDKLTLWFLLPVCATSKIPASVTGRFRASQ